jgi:hypothetical protein
MKRCYKIDWQPSVACTARPGSIPVHQHEHLNCRLTANPGGSLIRPMGELADYRRLERVCREDAERAVLLETRHALLVMAERYRVAADAIEFGPNLGPEPAITGLNKPDSAGMVRCRTRLKSLQKQTAPYPMRRRRSYFKTGALNHSATLPSLGCERHSKGERNAKGASCSPGLAPRRLAFGCSAKREGQQARAQQHKAGCGQGQKSVGD